MEVVGYKDMSQVVGVVEYTLSYENPILCGHDPHVAHVEQDEFRSLADLLRLLSEENLYRVQAACAADGIAVTAIQIIGENNDGDRLHARVEETLSGRSAATVTLDVAESKVLLGLQNAREQAEQLLDILHTSLK